MSDELKKVELALSGYWHSGETAGQAVARMHAELRELAERYDHREHMRRALVRLDELSERVQKWPDSENKDLVLWATGTSLVEVRAFMLAEAREVQTVMTKEERAEFDRFLSQRAKAADEEIDHGQP